jgi:hypothetical protein
MGFVPSRIGRLVSGIVIWGLIFATGAHIWLRLGWTADEAPPITRLVGKRISGSIREANARAEKSLSALAPGRCVYVVLTEPNCGVGVKLAKDWQRRVDQKQFDLGNSSRWQFVWVSVGDSTQMQDYYPSRFSFAQFFSVGASLRDELRLSAVPDHLILDATGRVLEADVGATLPRPEALRSDCTIAQPLPASQPKAVNP